MATFGAWVEGYWIDQPVGGTATISFEVPASGSMLWPWIELASVNIHALRAQLDSGRVFVTWRDVQGNKLIRITSFKRY